MEAENVWNPEKEKTSETETNDNNSNNEYDNISVRGTPSSWMSPPKRITNITNVLERATIYTHLIKEDWLLLDLQQSQKFEKRIASTNVRAKFFAPEITPSLHIWRVWGINRKQLSKKRDAICGMYCYPHLPTVRRPHK